MLVSGLTALDFHALLQLVLTALALLSGALLLLRKAASRYFVVDASFDPGEGDHDRMSIGGGSGRSDGGEAAPVPGACAVCRAVASKKCSRCKSVWYCSQACQSKHWEAHKLKCKQAKVSDKADIFSSDNGTCRRRKSSGFSSISLVPPRGACKVLQEPGQMLFPYEEFVKLFNWDKPGFLPCGLLNCGNSCFANVVLQCLTSTRPLVAYLLERDHSKGCVRKQDDWCFLCELQIHIQRASESLHPFSPINILSRLPNIGGNLGYGRQEDAHEFMRFAIDTMQSICLDEFGGEKYVDPSTQETTLIQHIFGGHLQSQVICTKCNAISNRYENMMDLTVEIQGDAGSLEECLNQFTTKEGLDGENMYKCDGCNDYVKAWKRLTVHQAPNILTIALKRFQSGRFGKLNKRVTFPEKLDLTPYMSGNGDGTDLYTLYAVVVHVDMLNASFFGHYICYTKDYQGHWFRIDDCKVTNVDVEEVLNQGAYMLLYSRTSARREPFIKTMEPAKKKHLVEVAPEASKPANWIRVDCVPSNVDLQSNIPLCEAPNGMFLHRDTGHDRNLSIKSNSFKETELENMDLDIYSEIKSMHVPKYLGDMNMDYSEPSLLQAKDLEGKSSFSPNVPEDISPVKPISSSPAEISLVEVRAMDCEEPCVNFDADICMEQATGTISIAGDLSKDILQDSFSSENIVNNMAVTFSGASVATSSSVLEPYVSSDADNCMEQDTMQIGISEAAFKMSKHTPEDSFHSTNFAHNMAETSCSISMSTKSVSEPSDDLRSNLESIVPACGPSDSANGINRMGDISCGKKGTSRHVSSWENGSGQSKPLFSPGFLDLPARKEPVNGNCGITHAFKVNGYINGHAELDFPEQRVCENAACLESLSGNGKDILPNSDTSVISLGFLNKSSRQSMNEDRIAGVGIDKSYLPCKTKCDDSAELSSLKQIASMNKEETGKMEIDDSNRPCNSSSGESVGPDFTMPSIPPRSGMSYLSPGFVNNSSKKLMTEDKIAKKESDKTDHPCKASCNGSAKLDFSKPSVRDKDACLRLHSANGNGILPSSSMTFLSRGFLNDSYKKLTNEDRIAKKEFNRRGHPCRTNGNGFAARASICETGNRDYRAETSLIDSYEKGPSGAAFVNGNGSCAYKKDVVLTSTLAINSNAGSAYDSEAVSGRCSGDQQQV